jgi:opacity protein-like surface antigen
MSRSKFSMGSIALAALFLSGVASAQGVSPREPGWEMGLDVIYQDAKTLKAPGGSKVDLEDDFGLSLTFGYRIDERLEVQFALDWSDVDYGGTIVRDNGTLNRFSGSYEAFTPRFNLQFNLLKTPFTPFISGGAGYTFIDTNIPTGRPQTGCWWDPWYGYICSSFQSTKTIDGLTYQVGAGIRWDLSDTVSLRLALEEHWVDFDKAGDEGLFQAKLGFSWRY